MGAHQRSILHPAAAIGQSPTVLPEHNQGQQVSGKEREEVARCAGEHRYQRCNVSAQQPDEAE